MSKWSSLVISLWSGKLNHNGVEEIKKFRTFGNHDLLTISPITGDTATEVLKNMWEKTNQLSCNIESGQSIHNWFAVKKSIDCDSFWENDSHYLFVSEIQLNFKLTSGFDEQLFLFENELKDLLSQEGLIENESYVVYYSLDCGDVILFLKTNTYSLGTDLINKITIKSKFKHYSYSVCGLNVESLLAEKDSETIPQIVISSVFSDASNYNTWYKRFSLEYPRKLCLDKNEKLSSRVFSFHKIKFNKPKDEFIHLSRLGNEDICITIYNCDIKHLLEMLYKEDGVFSNKNALVKSTFSRLRIQLDSKICDIKPTIVRDYSYGKSLVSELSFLWKRKLNGYVNPFVYKALVEVLTSLENLEKKEFAFDVLDCIRNVFPLFVKKIEAFNFDGFSFDFDTLDRGYSKADFDKDLILFTTGLMSIANGSLHADKLFINAPGFNAVLCDVPSKLLAYYTAYIQKLVSVLNDTDVYDYKFLLCPDLYLSIEVVSLLGYKKSDSQLLKARIPIKKLFDPEVLLMELSHEVAHFVGDKIRHRKERVNYLSDILATIFSDRLVHPIESEELENSNDIMEDISETKLIRSFFSEKDHQESFENILFSTWKDIPLFISKELCVDFDYDNNNLLFLDNLKNYFSFKTLEIFDNKMIFDEEQKSIIDHIFEVIVDNNTRLNRVEDVFLLSKLLERHISKCIIPEYKMIIEYACSLLSESFADLIMLYITRDPVAYLKNIYELETRESFVNNNTNYNSWDEPLVCEMRWERVLSVLNSLDFDLNSIVISRNDDEKFVGFLNSLKSYADTNNKFRAVPYHVIDINTEYLKLCLSDIKRYENKIETLRALYVVATTPNSVSDCIGTFRACEFDFRTRIIKENNLF